MPVSKYIPQRIQELVSESQAYKELLEFENRLDSVIASKCLDMREALKGPMKQKRKLRIFLSSTFYPSRPEGENGEISVPFWEFRVEGRLLDDPAPVKTAADTSKGRRKFSTFFRSLVIELDRELYGPDNLVEWHRGPFTVEADGFQVKRPGNQNVECTVVFVLDHQPPQYRLDSRLGCLLGLHTQTRAAVVTALWQYIKTHRLQDPHEHEYINCDSHLEKIFETKRLRFSEIPSKLHPLLAPPDPIVINYVISVDEPNVRKTDCHEVDVEVDDVLKQQMSSFLMSSQSQLEIAALNKKIYDILVNIDELKVNYDFFNIFAGDPLFFIDKWLSIQSRDLKTILDVAGNPEEERRADFMFQPWAQEAVCRYLYAKVQQRRLELERALNTQNSEMPTQK